MRVPSRIGRLDVVGLDQLAVVNCFLWVFMEQFIQDHFIDKEALNYGIDQFILGCAEVILLHDRRLHRGFLARLLDLSSVPLRVVDVENTSPSILDGQQELVGVIYACLRDDLGLPFVERAYRNGIKVVSVYSAQPRSYLWRNSVAMNVLRQELEHQSQEGFMKVEFGIGDFVNLIQAFDRTSSLSGCIVELGCFRGSSAGALLSYVATQFPRNSDFSLDLFYLDVFDGFSYPEALRSSDAVWAGTHSTEGLEGVRDRIQAYASEVEGMNVHVLRCNVISDPVPETISDQKIRLLNIDVDLYEAVLSSLHRYAQYVVVGGVVFCEDAGHTPLLIGAYKAVQEFMESPLGRCFFRFDLPSGQTMLVRVAS